MKMFKDFMLEEYQDRVKQLGKDVELKKADLEKIDADVRKAQLKLKQKYIYAVEKEGKGCRVTVHKSNEVVKVYDEQMNEITALFEPIISQFAILTEKDYIIDGKMIVVDQKGNFITKLSQDCKDVCFFVHDLVYFAESDMTTEPWNKRRKLLKQFKFTENIKENPAVIVKDKKSVEEAAIMFSKLKGAEGVTLKRYDGLYVPNGETDTWINFNLSEGSIENGKGN